MAQENNIMTLSSLRNDRTFATISQFFHTFQSAYQPWPNYAESQWTTLLHRPPSNRMKTDATQDDYVFSTEDLEDMLLDTSRRHQIEELMVRMLRLLTRNRFISTSTWQDYFSREWDRRESDQANPFHKNEPSNLTAITNDQAGVTQDEIMTVNSHQKHVSFFDLPIEARLILLNALCEWQLDDPERLREHLNDEQDATQWRVDPIGHDRKGNTFWLFDDNRLYQESALPNKKKSAHRKKKKPTTSTRRSVRRSTRNTSQTDDNPEEEEEDEEWIPWKLVCMTVDEWQRFPQKYGKSNHPQDQQLHQLLVDDVLPKVIPVIEEHEKERKRQEAIIYRKRSSRILVRELEALEQHQVESDDTSSLSRSEQRRIQKEAEEKEKQAKAREERIMERERRLFAKTQAEERAAEKARLDRERRLQRRHGADDDGDIDIGIMVDEDSTLQQQQGFKLILKVAGPKKKSKSKKGTNDLNLGKRKRGRKPKVRLQEDDESWTFNCTCGVFGKNIDDGAPMIACERCDEWQHIECLRKSGQVDTRLTSFDDLTFVCRRCIEKERAEGINVDDTNTIDETKIKKAMPTPPDTTTDVDPSHRTGYQHNSPLVPVIQSSERHFLQQPSKTLDHSSSYTSIPYTESNKISSFDTKPLSVISSEALGEHQQQRILPSLLQHYSRSPVQLDALQAPDLPSSSSSSSHYSNKSKQI